jgi:hypothetical protein
MRLSSTKKPFAEFALIVIGVFFALFAENQWQARLDREEGREYLRRIRTEVGANQGALEGDLDWAAQACTSAEAFLDFLQNPTLESDATSLLKLAVSAAMHARPAFETSTYDEMIASGRLSLINDARLRARIVASYGTMRMDEVWRPTTQDPFRLAVLRTLPFDFVEGVLLECLLTSDGEAVSRELRDCTVEPTRGSPGLWLSRLTSHQDLIGDLRLRVYGVCRFGHQLEPTIAALDSLSTELDRQLRQ